MARSRRSRRRISRFRRGSRGKTMLRGITSMDMGSRVGNVLFGAGVSTAGQVIAPRLPVIGAKLGEVSANYGPPVAGLAVGLLPAAYNWYKGRKRTAKDIAMGAALPAVAGMLKSQAEKLLNGLGFVTADLAAVTAAAHLAAGGQQGYQANVLQGSAYGHTGMGYAANVLQGYGF